MKNAHLFFLLAIITYGFILNIFAAPTVRPPSKYARPTDKNAKPIDKNYKPGDKNIKLDNKKYNSSTGVPRPNTAGPRPNIPNPNIKNGSQIPKMTKKKMLKDKLPDYESKMQALTGCYFIFEKIMSEHTTEYSEFVTNSTYNKTEFFIRFRLDHIMKCLKRIGDFNLSRVLENIADNNIAPSYYERNGFMKFDLEPYKHGNVSFNYTSTDELLINFINEIDETIDKEENFSVVGEKIHVFNSKTMLYISLIVIFVIFALVLYYITKKKDLTKKAKKDQKNKKNKKEKQK